MKVNILNIGLKISEKYNSYYAHCPYVLVLGERAE